MPRKRPRNLAVAGVLREAKERKGIGDKDLARAVQISERSIQRHLSGQLPTEVELARYQFQLDISPQTIKDAVERGQYGHLKEVYRTYRENRHDLRPIARKYYAKVAHPDFRVVTKSQWLAGSPIPLAQFDQELQKHWMPNEPKLHLPPSLLRLLDGLTYSNLIARIDPEVEQENRFCYRLITVRTQDRFELVCCPSQYSDFINSCDALGFELADWYLRNHKTARRSPRSNGTDLPARRPARQIFNFQNRAACIAISTVLLVLHKSPGRHYFYLAPRASKRLLDSPGGWHVVPSGQFQPETPKDANHDRDFSVERNVMREFAEELLGKKKLEQLIWDEEDFYEDPKVRPLVRGLKSGFVRMYFLGMGCDPVPTKPGLFTAMVIDARHVPKGILKFLGNWESGGKVLPVLLNQLEKYSLDPDVIPDGATCLKLAHQHLDVLMAPHL